MSVNEKNELMGLYVCVRWILRILGVASHDWKKSMEYMSEKTEPGQLEISSVSVLELRFFFFSLLWIITSTYHVRKLLILAGSFSHPCVT
jgi:hypothetical protein